eukprot:gb/GEZN01011700.1/.p1 GENE.gb/GEZN01011700.1/~~gb/GEZN01011700.1/.p1  ORF type:complete len:338 (-),score=25.12 gb/GEZN01011700.1/:124-1098(-)
MNEGSPVIHAISGSTAAMGSLLLLYPFEKLRVQLHLVPKGTTAAECIRALIAERGLAGLYTGLQANLYGVGISTLMYFFIYSSLSSYVSKGGQQALNSLQRLSIASIAGALNVIITIPMWVVNTRLMAAIPREKDTETSKDAETTGTQSKMRRASSKVDMISVCRSIIQNEGARGFYRGLVPALLLVSNPAVQFMVYEKLVAMARTLQGGRRSGPLPALPSWQYFVIAAFAKAMATVVSYPFQIVKTRLMVRPESSQNTFACLLELWREDTVFALYRGMATKLTQTVLNGAFMFTMYEHIVALCFYVCENGSANLLMQNGSLTH